MFYYVLMAEQTQQFIQRARKFIEKEKIFQKGDTLVAGVSGGADSVCLFEVLTGLKAEYDLKLTVVCVDHGLRPEAKEEVSYVEGLCREKGISFLKREADVMGFAKEKGLGTEEAGRILRYRIFEEIADDLGPDAKIAVAHNKNDLAETFLFNLFRGTGPKGLSSLRPVRGRIVRPLLFAEREEIEAFLSDLGVKYHTDASNLTDDYSRNKIRHHVLEYAKTGINEGSVSHIAEAADRIGQLNDILERQADKSLADEILSQTEREVVVKRTAFTGEEEYVAAIKTKKCIDLLVPHNKDITSVHLMAVKEIADKTGTHETSLPYGITVMASGDRVRFLLGNAETDLKEYPLKGGEGELLIPGLGRVKWNVFSRPGDFAISQNTYTKSFDYDKINKCLTIRNPLPGDVLTVNAKLQKKKLSDYLKDEKVPLFERAGQFVLADGDRIWWVIGRRISELPKITEETKRILEVTVERET